MTIVVKRMVLFVPLHGTRHLHSIPFPFIFPVSPPNQSTVFVLLLYTPYYSFWKLSSLLWNGDRNPCPSWSIDFTVLCVPCDHTHVLSGFHDDVQWATTRPSLTTLESAQRPVGYKNRDLSQVVGPLSLSQENSVASFHLACRLFIYLMLWGGWMLKDLLGLPNVLMGWLGLTSARGSAQNTVCIVHSIWPVGFTTVPMICDIELHLCRHECKTLLVVMLSNCFSSTVARLQTLNGNAFLVEQIGRILAARFQPVINARVNIRLAP